MYQDLENDLSAVQRLFHPHLQKIGHYSLIIWVELLQLLHSTNDRATQQPRPDHIGLHRNKKRSQGLKERQKVEERITQKVTGIKAYLVIITPCAK